MTLMTNDLNDHAPVFELFPKILLVFFSLLELNVGGCFFHLSS